MSGSEEGAAVPAGQKSSWGGFIKVRMGERRAMRLHNTDEDAAIGLI